MKKLVLLLFISLSINTFGGNSLVIKKQDYSTLTLKNINLNLSNFSLERRNTGETNPGVVAMISGGSFMLAGILTGSLNYGLSSTRKQPIINQPGRLAAIVTGGVVFLGGVGYVITF